MALALWQSEMQRCGGLDQWVSEGKPGAMLTSAILVSSSQVLYLR